MDRVDRLLGWEYVRPTKYDKNEHHRLFKLSKTKPLELMTGA